MNENHKFPYKWHLRDGYPAKGIEYHGKTVFSTFACGGGSTMGYKLAGYNVIAANDIDNKMRQVYIANHHPKHYVFGDIRKLLNFDYPEDFYNLDVLDGSPPCSTFSTAGQRERGWGKEKVFREGQAKQTLDDLFFEFIKLAKKLKPKIVISENVKGIIAGNAKGYVKEIIREFENAGYYTQAFLLNAATMGVPQRRERVFFISKRKDLMLSSINFVFNESSIPFVEVESQIDYSQIVKKPLSVLTKSYWMMAKQGDSVDRFMAKRKIRATDVLSTILGNSDGQYHYREPRGLVNEEYALCGTFPLDYNYLDIQPKYLIGMSVPPVMMAQVASQVYEQWLSKLN